MDLSFCLFFLLNFPEDVTFSIGCNVLIIIVLQNDFRFLALIGFTRWSKTVAIIESKDISHLTAINYIISECEIYSL